MSRDAAAEGWEWTGTPTDWERTARRDGTDSCTVAGMACFAVHEAHHHLLDASGRLPASA